MRVLVVGWSSVLHGEATAGDVLAMEAVTDHLVAAGIECRTAWSAVMRPVGGLALDDADPADFTHVVWACGPLHGEPVLEVHRRFAGCVRIAVGVSVLDPDDPAVRGFATVVARDVGGRVGRKDLAARVSGTGVPVVGVFLARGQGEYGNRRLHHDVSDAIGAWLAATDVACLDLETRLDPRDWRHPTTPGHVESVIRRLDAVLTTRLHGLVLALKNGVPVIAVDPVRGGAKVSAQARAWGSPVIRGEDVSTAVLDAALRTALSPAGRAAAAAAAASAAAAGTDQLAELLDQLRIVEEVNR